jgi:hypothetical protein
MRMGDIENRYLRSNLLEALALLLTVLKSRTVIMAGIHTKEELWNPLDLSI